MADNRKISILLKEKVVHEDSLFVTKGRDMNKLFLLEEVKELVRIDDNIEVLDRDNEKFIPKDAPLLNEIEPTSKPR
ncbi:MAG: hypothetical protein HDR24_08360 [Lachnospiraceae bacterium]|nr:hypothetical protein [Lachnospiraceae bacterium]